MTVCDCVVVTITLARSREEESALLQSLRKLTAPGLRLVVADGGSSKRFTKELLKLGTISYFVIPEEKGLVQQVKAGLFTALNQFGDKRAILYTEPDKYPFFKGPWLEFVKRARVTERLGVTVVARDSKSFRTFPKGQQRAEAFMSEAFSWLFGKTGDYCYGPLLLSRSAAEMALDAPNDLGWGWRFWTMRRAHAMGLRVHTVPMNLPCPKEQRGEDSLEDRLYRLKQLKQNIQAITVPS